MRVQGMDAPGEKVEGCSKPQLMLLNDISGAFKPGVLTCLMGTSGAGGCGCGCGCGSLTCVCSDCLSPTNACRFCFSISEVHHTPVTPTGKAFPASPMHRQMQPSTVGVKPLVTAV